MPDPVNSREAPRVAIDAVVRVDSEDGNEYVFQTRDLSISGLFLYSRISHSYPFKVGSRLKLELLAQDHEVRCTVVVVRIVEQGSAESKAYPTGFGVKIVDIDEADRRHLGLLVGGTKQQGAA